MPPNSKGQAKGSRSTRSSAYLLRATQLTAMAASACARIHRPTHPLAVAPKSPELAHGRIPSSGADLHGTGLHGVDARQIEMHDVAKVGHG
eukprot:CAMPEP_0183582018 /NCGR_PEP_ID=MMETSP0371-20130417/148870_1 /TAXON_ID=268820 /ORGANISM="Peridinium aciculiferum, Strain PAER-2" /LENGTH=90 /DNA_ID=CAMNT_0025792733 /DNA_START=95 /DNA_END=364 /DNA_ORIENTATION=-